MKLVASMICLLLGTSVTFGAIPLPQTTDTNAFAAMYWANRANIASQNSYLAYGRLIRLESEVNRLETAFVCLAIVVGSSLAAVCLLAARDQIRRWSNRLDFEQDTTEPRTIHNSAPESITPGTALSGSHQTL